MTFIYNLNFPKTMKTTNAAFLVISLSKQRKRSSSQKLSLKKTQDQTLTTSNV